MLDQYVATGGRLYYKSICDFCTDETLDVTGQADGLAATEYPLAYSYIQIYSLSN